VSVEDREPLSAEIEDPASSGDWADVRESWVDLESAAVALQPASGQDMPHRVTGPASVPPALPPPHVVSAMLERLSAGDYDGTLIAARAALDVHPTNDDAQQCREMASRALRKLYVERLGMVAGRPCVPRRVRRGRGLELQARRVLELVDGVRTIEDIVDIAKPEPLDSLRILSELALANLIYVETE